MFSESFDWQNSRLRFSRRELLLGTTSLVACLSASCDAQVQEPASASDSASPYKRSVLNMQIPAWWEKEHIWVDFIRGSSYAPAGYSSQTDAKGFASKPNTPFKASGVAALPRA